MSFNGLSQQVNKLPFGVADRNVRTLEKVQKALTLATGLSLAVVFTDRIQVAAFSHPEDELHPLLLADPEKLIERVSQPDPNFRVQPGTGGLAYLVHPVHLEGRNYGYALGGPVWETPPPDASLQELADELGVELAVLRKALAHHPAPVPLDVSRAKETLISLAELASQTLQDQFQHAKNLSTLAALYEVGSVISSTIHLEDVLKKGLRPGHQPSRGRERFIDAP